MRRVFAVAMTALGCACSSSTASPPPATLAPEFVGSWARSGTLTITCPGMSPIATTLGMDLVIVLSSASAGDSVVATAPDGCMTTFTVSGTVATQDPGQSCPVTADGGLTEVFTQTTHTLTLSADEQSLTEAASGTVARTVGGKTSMCTESSSGTFTKQ